MSSILSALEKQQNSQQKSLSINNYKRHPFSVWNIMFIGVLLLLLGLVVVLGYLVFTNGDTPLQQSKSNPVQVVKQKEKAVIQTAVPETQYAEEPLTQKPAKNIVISNGPKKMHKIVFTTREMPEYSENKVLNTAATLTDPYAQPANQDAATSSYQPANLDNSTLTAQNNIPISSQGNGTVETRTLEQPDNFGNETKIISSELQSKPQTNQGDLDYSTVSASLKERFELALLASENSPPPVQEAPPVDNRDLHEMSDSFQSLVPIINYEAHMYSSDLNERWIRINGERMVEGMQFKDTQLKLVEIEPNKSIFRLGRQSFTLESLTDWKGY